jgi:hypothetical protein
MFAADRLVNSDRGVIAAKPHRLSPKGASHLVFFWSKIRTRDPHLGKAMEPVRPILGVRFVGFRAQFVRSGPQSFVLSDASRIAR